jgi:transposase
MQIITCGFQSMDTSSLKVKFSIQNVFTVIFEICGCKNQFIEMLGDLKTAISINYCYISNTNDQVQRQNFDSERC